MPDTVLRTEKIGNVDTVISVTDRGFFKVRDAETQTTLGSAASMEEAIKAARPEVAKRKVRVSVPFVSKAGERGEATGLHATNGSVLARLDGTAVQLSDYHERKVFKAEIPPSTLGRYLDLFNEARIAKREMATIEKEFEIDLLALVRREVDAKAKEVTDATAKS